MYLINVFWYAKMGSSSFEVFLFIFLWNVFVKLIFWIYIYFFVICSYCEKFKDALVNKYKQKL